MVVVVGGVKSFLCQVQPLSLVVVELGLCQKANSKKEDILKKSMTLIKEITSKKEENLRKNRS